MLGQKIIEKGTTHAMSLQDSESQSVGLWQATVVASM